VPPEQKSRSPYSVGKDCHKFVTADSSKWIDLERKEEIFARLRANRLILVWLILHSGYRGRWFKTSRPDHEFTKVPLPQAFLFGRVQIGFRIYILSTLSAGGPVVA
jgi:hypothetical protein